MKKLISVFLAVSMLASLASCTSKEVKNAQSLIDALPDTYTENIEQSFSDAKAAYEILTDEDKAEVDNTKINQLEISKKVYGVQVVIDALPDEYTEGDDKIIEDAKAAYNTLSADEKSMADDTKITALEESKKEFEEREIHKYARIVNVEVEAYASKTTDLKGINACYNQLLRLNDVINSVPEESCKYIDFDRISAKNTELTKAVYRIKSELKEIDETLAEFTDIYTSMNDKISYQQYTWVRTACGNIIKDLNVIGKYTTVDSEIRNEINELKNAASNKDDFAMELAWVGAINDGISYTFTDVTYRYKNLNIDEKKISDTIRNIDLKKPEGGVVAVEPITTDITTTANTSSANTTSVSTVTTVSDNEK